MLLSSTTIPLYSGYPYNYSLASSFSYCGLQIHRRRRASLLPGLNLLEQLESAPAPSVTNGWLVVSVAYTHHRDKLTVQGGSGSGTAGSSEPTSESKSDSEPAAAVEKRAGSITDSLDLKSFFTHTGTAILATFYLSLFISICLMIRYRVMKPFTPDLPEIGDDPKVPRKEVVGAKRRALKIFAYRTSRSMAVINAIVLFGILSACGKAVWDVRVKLKLKGTDGIGGGLFRE